jgi:hypothetical protein
MLLGNRGDHHRCAGLAMGRTVRWGSALVSLCLAAPAFAGQDSQLWTTASATVKLSERWRVSEDITARFSDDRNGLYEVESNTLLGYKLNQVVGVWAGYTHDPQYAAGHFTVMEHRAREQITFDNFTQLGTGKLTGRVRFEQRWRDGLDGTAWRVRPYLKYTLPLHKGGRTAFVLSAEPFFNLNRTAFARTEGLDRVRSLVGVSTPLNKAISLEAGYLNQHTFVRHGSDNDDHVASISLNLTL